MRIDTSVQHPDFEQSHRLISPYGGNLIQSFSAGPEGQALLMRLETKPRIALSEREFLDLEMLASGVFSPLTGFMDRVTYLSVRENRILPSGLPWGWPVTLAVTDDLAGDLKDGDEAGLYFHDLPVGIITISDLYQWEPNLEAFAVFDSATLNPTAIAERISQQKMQLIGGNINLVVDNAESGSSEHHIWPGKARLFFELQKWNHISSITGLSAWHRTDEHIMRSILEYSDALILQTVPERYENFGGLSPALIQEARQSVIRNYFPRLRVLDNQLTKHIDCEPVRALLQMAIISQNYGCDHLFINSPPAHQTDPANFKRACGELEGLVTDKLDIEIEFIDSMFYCDACGTAANIKSCPHEESHHKSFDEKIVESSVRTGEALPSYLARPEVSRVLFRKDLHQVDNARLKRTNNLYPHSPEISRSTRNMISGHKSAVLWMTGLSGSGKSTIAHRLERELLMSGHRVSILDGDTLRTGLCSDLGFSREARQENLRRAAEVAKVMRNSGMLVIASFISPFRSEREMLVDIVGEGFYEVYIEASLETCEQRDPKGLYGRARSGVIRNFTGISSPYEPPENPAIRISTDNETVEESAHKLMMAIADLGLLRVSKEDLPLRAHRSTLTTHNLRA